MKDNCPKCGIELERTGLGIIVDNLHPLGGYACLERQINQAKARIAELTENYAECCEEVQRILAEKEVMFDRIAELEALVDKLCKVLKGRLDAALCTANMTPEENNILCRSCWHCGPMPDELVGHSWDTVPHKKGCPWKEVTEVLKEATRPATETVSATNQTERLIYAAMVEAGWIFPTTLEQVAAAEKELAENPIELPDELKDPKAFIARMENQNG